MATVDNPVLNHRFHRIGMAANVFEVARFAAEYVIHTVRAAGFDLPPSVCQEPEKLPSRLCERVQVRAQCLIVHMSDYSVFNV